MIRSYKFDFYYLKSPTCMFLFLLSPFSTSKNGNFLGQNFLHELGAALTTVTSVIALPYYHSNGIAKALQCVRIQDGVL